MYRKFFSVLFFVAAIGCLSPSAMAALEFSVHKLESAIEGPTVLVVGGIQGDEPGGFHAASLLVTDYEVERGNLWVVPNLNFESIIRRSRGVNGDMNRKFAELKPDDPDYQAVERIKALIKSPEIDFIVNLHDGSGFYRERYIDKLHSPHRWGQSIIIDQEKLHGSPYPEVGALARKVVERVNNHLLSKEHSYRVRNTRTAEGDEEMAKTLTYFAINNGKPALGLEASKSLPTRERVYYHLHLMEALLAQLGVGVKRSFPLQPLAIKEQIMSDIRLAMFDERLHMDVADARHQLNYFPMSRAKELDYSTSNPLVALVPRGDQVRVSYGNRRMTLLNPQFFEADDSLNTMEMEIDGERRNVMLGSTVTVNKAFSAHPPEGYRINVIGWRRAGVQNEARQRIERGEIQSHFSIDQHGTTYRVEVYRDEKFSGMVLVTFDASSLAKRNRDKTGGAS